MKFSRSRRVALAGGASVVLGAAALGIAGAQEVIPPKEHTADVLIFRGVPGEHVQIQPIDLEERRQKFLETLAGKLGVEADRLEQAFRETTEELGMPLPLLGLAGPSAVPVDAVRIELDLGEEQRVIAQALGISEQQLREERMSRSLRAIAEAHGVDPQTVVDAIVAYRTGKIDEAVRAGNLPSDVGERMKTRLAQEIEHFIDLPHGFGARVFVQHMQRTQQP